jgi:hypothetical protein
LKVALLGSIGAEESVDDSQCLFDSHRDDLAPASAARHTIPQTPEVRLLFNVLAMAEFESDLIKMRSRERLTQQ